MHSSVAEALDLPTWQDGGLALYQRLTWVVRDDLVERVFYPIFPERTRRAGAVLAPGLCVTR